MRLMLLLLLLRLVRGERWQVISEHSQHADGRALDLVRSTSIHRHTPPHRITDATLISPGHIGRRAVTDGRTDGQTLVSQRSTSD